MIKVMLNWIIFWLIAFGSFVAYDAMAANLMVNTALPDSVIAALQKAKIPQANVAVYVQSVDESKAIVFYNANQSFNPASVMKLVTTNAALELLGRAYRWRTEVYRDGLLSNGVLEGNLIIKGYGDPSFNEAEMRRMLVSLQQAGVKEIHGNLVLDKTYFASSVGSRVTFDAETYRAYNAMPSAFLVNARATSFKFQGDGGSANVVQEVEVPEIKINNQLRLSQFDCDQWSGEWRSKLGYAVTTKAKATTIAFNGSYAANCGDKYLELSLFDDAQYAYFLFRKLWKELGGSFVEGVDKGGLQQQAVMPTTAVKMLAQESKPLSEVIRDINKYSNNLMARQLLLTIAAETSGLPATEALGGQAIRAWLLSKNTPFNELVIENGSGLSRIERISAQHLGDLLVNAYHGPIMPELMASLPILGIDGTVMKRLKDSQVSGRAHLKTGSLDGVSTIAGYVLDNKNRRWVVVFLVNHALASGAKNAQNSLLEWVYAQP